jgi:hypothetical protein
MSGRGDNNKKGSSGQGASNQSNQPFVSDGEDHPKSNHQKRAVKGKASKPQEKSGDQSSDRNEPVKNKK